MHELCRECDTDFASLQRRGKHWEEPGVEIELMGDDEYEMEEPVRKPRVRKPAAIFTGTKLNVSNLDLGVTETDVKDLFSDVGELKSYKLLIDEHPGGWARFQRLLRALVRVPRAASLSPRATRRARARARGARRGGGV